MKTQTGMRLDVQMWTDFKALCWKFGLGTNEVVEAFLKVCIEREDLTSVLNTLKAENPDERLANELTLRESISDLETLYHRDRRHETANGTGDAYCTISAVIENLRKVTDPQLLEKAMAIVEKASAYYHQKEETAEEESAENVEEYSEKNPMENRPDLLKKARDLLKRVKDFTDEDGDEEKEPSESEEQQPGEEDQ